MDHQKLSVRAFSRASGLVWASAVLFTGFVNLKNPEYGKSFLDMMGSLYAFHPETHSVMSVFILSSIGMLDGVIAGAFFAWIYNQCLKVSLKN